MKQFDTVVEALKWLVGEAALYESARAVKCTEEEAVSPWGISTSPFKVPLSISEIYTGAPIPPFKAKTHCHVCNETETFACGSAARPEDLPLDVSETGVNQTLVLRLVCAHCDANQMVLIERTKDKVQLTGYAPMRAIKRLPPWFPKTQAEFYSEALVAYGAGKPLAAIFFLRVFIEQVFRAVPGTRVGEDNIQKLGRAYKETIPSGLKSTIPSLQKVYDELSEAIHAAKAPAILYRRSVKQIDDHFAAIYHENEKDKRVGKKEAKPKDTKKKAKGASAKTKARRKSAKKKDRG